MKNVKKRQHGAPVSGEEIKPRLSCTREIKLRLSCARRSPRDPYEPVEAHCPRCAFARILRGELVGRDVFVVSAAFDALEKIDATHRALVGEPA